MIVFDLMRHPEDTDDGGITENGSKQTSRLITNLRKKGYDYFSSSPYSRCATTLERITRDLNVDKSSILTNLKLCTPKPKEWDNVFSSKQFQELLPIAGSKYNAALSIAPDLLINDALYLESELVNASRSLPKSSRVFCISHNTMILAAYYLTVFGSLTIREAASLEHCQIVRFVVSHDKLRTKIIPKLPIGSQKK